MRASKVSKKKLNEAELQRLFGKRIQYFRKQQNLTQQKLVERANLSGANYLSEIERGRRSPRFDLLLRIANALDVDVYQFLKVDDEDVDMISKDIARQRVAALDERINKNMDDVKKLKADVEKFLKILGSK